MTLPTLGHIEAIANYFQGIDPGSAYVPKCDKDRSLPKLYIQLIID